MKAKQIVDIIIANCDLPFELENTCDTYLSGSPDTTVTGVVTTFMATVEVIKKAARLGANMIITHEPVYFTANDSTDWLADDPVYLAKKKLLEENDIVIWRYHDHMHMKKPDMIYEGLIKALNWEIYAQHDEESGDYPDTDEYFAKSFSNYYDIPETTLNDLARYFMERLQMDHIRILGDSQTTCKRVGILVGGGSLGLGREEMPMQVMHEKNIDVLVCGEITEWTLPAYVNDAQALGFCMALLIVGHERSEEWGMKYMAEWLKPLIPALSVAFIDAKEPFTYVNYSTKGR